MSILVIEYGATHAAPKHAMHSRPRRTIDPTREPVTEEPPPEQLPLRTRDRFGADRELELDVFGLERGHDNRIRGSRTL